MIATLVVAVPIITVAALAAVFLKNQAMRYGVSPDGQASQICAFGVYIRPETNLVADGPSWASECVADGDSLQLPPVKVDDLRLPGVGTSETVISVFAQRTSGPYIPHLSLWPFTDTDSIEFGRWRTDGTVEGRYPLSRLGLSLDPDDPTTMKDLGPVYEARWLKVRNQLTQAQRTLNLQIMSLGGGALSLIGLFALVAWVATGRVLRPVEAIRRQMADITEHDLTRRVPVPRAHNEIARLTTTVNTTLDRLQAAVEENRRFVADASHELRSPITALRAELEIATAHPDQADWPNIVDAALADTQRLQSLATDLLLLARLDQTATTPAAVHAGTVDLTALATDHIARRRTRHTLIADLPDYPVSVPGRHAALERLVGNLLDNAEHHATTTVTIRLATTDDHAVLEIVDDGPGIPPEDRERVFDRFTRLDDARTRDSGGTGLGLPIARRIATTHGGTLNATDHPNRHGARLVATLPRTPSNRRPALL
ncbi:sensor histidine kinase [Saccharothrix sp. NRRL B-16348]|uniref:sensor histidine kinase n=1 Tax=Saccharothrix sp. NRRL B-16348 TaxID=1415542 RepID=UPI0009E97202|nr:HAMP domain-containing sensor histidine kinase [Saccharothrix sp. NRRL B-16348]